MATNANTELFDATVRNQIRLRRYSLWEARRTAKLLGETEADLVKLLRDKLEKLAGLPHPTPNTPATRRLDALLAEVRDLRAAAWQRVANSVNEAMRDLAKGQSAQEKQTLEASAPIKLELATPAVATVVAAATKRPMQGRLLGEWYRSLASADRARLSAQIRIGVAEGETVEQIVARVRGSAAQAYEDGALFAAKRDAAAVVRTAVSAVSNAAREEVWKENSDIISGLRYTAVLDGRTTAICRSLDGEVYDIGDGPRPPQHVGCRSIMVAEFDGDGVVGTRPTVTDTRTRADREVDFRQTAKDEGITIQQARSDWADEAVGQTDAGTTYSQFLSRQSASFQDEVLGQAKGQLYRTGGVTLDQFVDRAGNELTLDQLHAKYPAAWGRTFGADQ